MTPKDGTRIKPEWSNTLSRLLGTEEWQEALYKPKVKPPIEDIFGYQEFDEKFERLNIDELRDWVTNRLKELFEYVAEPVLLKNNNRPLFLFYFAVSNDSNKAKALANRIVNSILEKHRK